MFRTLPGSANVRLAEVVMVVSILASSFLFIRKCDTSAMARNAKKTHTAPTPIPAPSSMLRVKEGWVGRRRPSPLMSHLSMPINAPTLQGCPRYPADPFERTFDNSLGHTI